MVRGFLSLYGKTLLLSDLSCQYQVCEEKHKELEKQVKKHPHFPESAFFTECNGHGPIFCPLCFTDDLV